MRDGKDKHGHPIACLRSTLRKNERNYLITWKELLAAIKNIIISDAIYTNDNLCNPQTCGNSMAEKLQRTDWLVSAIVWVSAYNFIVQHRPGRKDRNSDARSRKSTTNKCFRLHKMKTTFLIWKPRKKTERFWVTLYTLSLPTQDRISNNFQCSTTNKSCCWKDSITRCNEWASLLS